jgi:DeoR/GlpR family transcriptional regulator of sugar metabolism
MTRPIAVRRHDEILRRIEQDGSVSVAELADLFGVSRETIRRDLKQLSEGAQLRLVHGGATRAQPAEAALAQRSQENAEGKAIIGRTAAALVPDGASVILDSGSTTALVATQLLSRRNLRVFTNALGAAQLLCRVKGNEVYVLGGEIDPNDESAMGWDTIAALSPLRADFAFVGAGGITEDGVSDYTRVAAELRGRMLAAAKEPFIVADHSKFGRLTPARVQLPARLSGVITDREPPQILGDALARTGLRIVVGR